MNKKIFSILLFLSSSMYACATLCMDSSVYPNEDSLQNKLRPWRNYVEKNSLLQKKFEDLYGSFTDETYKWHKLYDMHRNYGPRFGFATPYSKLPNQNKPNRNRPNRSRYSGNGYRNRYLIALP